jgi:NitT/TauT family transport system permease protein
MTKRETEPRRASLWRTRPEVISVPLLFVVVVGAWQITLVKIKLPSFLLPTPWTIARRLASELLQTNYWYHTGVTLLEVGLGFAIAAIGGVLIAAVIAEVVLIEKTVYPYLVAFQTLPKIAIAPLLIIWLGFGLESKVLIAAMVAIFPVLVNMLAGLKTVDPKRLALMRALSANKWQIFLKLKLPSSLPFLFAGLDTAVVFAVLGAIVGEFVGASKGLGSLIIQMRFAMDVAGVFSVLVILAAIGITLHLVMQFISRRMAFWADTSQLTSR